jgi:hypothetical protein
VPEPVDRVAILSLADFACAPGPISVKSSYGPEAGTATRDISAEADYRPSRPSLPRSLHRPVAVVDGSLTKNTNRIGVRLWTDRSFDKDGEIRARARSG